MLSFFKRLFESDTAPVTAEIGSRIAACALLIVLAEVDGEVSDAETAAILGLLQREHNLTAAQARALLAEAQEVSDARIDLWQLTRRLNERCSKDERLRIVELLWEVVYADGHFDDHEHHMMSKIPDLLRLERGQVIDRKLAVRDRVAPKS